MSAEASPARPHRARRRGPSAHIAFAALAVGLAVCALIGWLSGFQLLTSFLAGRPSMSPMTAAGLIVAASGSAALPQRKAFGLGLGLLQMVLGACLVTCHLMGWHPATVIPATWWTSKFTAALLAASGAATVLLATRHYVTGQVLSFGVLMLSALMGLAHVVPQADLYKVLSGTGVSIPTVLALGAVSLSQIMACRTSGIAGALGSRTLAGRTGRYLLFCGAGAVLAVSVLLALAYRLGLLDAESAMVLLVWCAVTILGATLWGLAVAVDRAELAREEAERLRDQQRDLVSAALSHDIRSPLQAAMMSASLLQRLVVDEQALRAVERLQRSHRRMDRMLRSLLDSLTLGSGGSLHLRADEVILHDVVAEVVAENAAILDGRVAWDGTAQGWWDRDAIYRVLENLLLNAAKYGMPLTPILCRIATRHGMVCLSVENVGSPIPEERWETIFESFQRGTEEHRAELPGWGVGLAFARVVADRHGGCIRVAASNADVTVFEFMLPVDSRAALYSQIARH